MQRRQFIVAGSAVAAATALRPGRLFAEEAADASPIELKSGELSVTVDPAAGGRVGALEYAGVSLIRTERDENGWHWGGQMWPSPQRDWGWPPPAAIDSHPHRVVIRSDDTVTLRSDVDPKVGLSVTKTYRLLSPTQVWTSYRIHNHGDAPRDVAVWQTNRVPINGTILLPDDIDVRSEQRGEPSEPIVMERGDGHRTFELSEELPDSTKLFVDVPDRTTPSLTLRRDGVQWSIAVPTFGVDDAKAAPGESPLEIYFAIGDRFVELEVQAPLRRIEPGGEAGDGFVWNLRRI